MNPEFQSLLDQLRTAGNRVNAQADVMTLTASFFDTAPMVGWIKTVSPAGDIQMLRVNQAYERVLGITTKEYEAQEDCIFHSPETSEIARKGDLEAIESGEPQRVDNITRNKLTGVPVRLVGWKWRVPLNGSAVAICGFAQEYPIP